MIWCSLLKFKYISSKIGLLYPLTVWNNLFLRNQVIKSVNIRLQTTLTFIHPKLKEWSDVDQISSKFIEASLELRKNFTSATWFCFANSNSNNMNFDKTLFNVFNSLKCQLLLFFPIT